MTLSKRILSASTDDEAREVLEELAEAVGLVVPGWSDPYFAVDFQATLEARAYLSAAEMLVPEGWLIVQLSDIGLAGGCMCVLDNPGTSVEIIEDTGARGLWQALAAAIAKTREG